MATVYKTNPGEMVPGDDPRQHSPAFTRDLMGDAVEQCSFCGERAAAFWQSGGLVSVCATCATCTLPKLIADALIGEFRPHARIVPNLLHSVTVMEAVFWKAAAIAIARAARLPDQSCRCKGGEK